MLARDRLREVDVNQIVTGTIDSLCADLLTLYRPPGTQPPVEADEYVARTLVLREGCPERAVEEPETEPVLMELDGRGPSDTFRWNTGSKASALQALADRRVHDQIDLDTWAAAAEGDEFVGRQRALEALAAYDAALSGRQMLDFAGIEATTLQWLTAGLLDEFLGEVRVVLVDEYQDTNFLQEQLYFALASSCNGALTVVGDDEQSLYRFRGATVELFLDFDRRYRDRFHRKPTRVYLHTNHRSSRTIVRFVQSYATVDPQYRKIRAKGKPELESPKPDGAPILAMFRDTVEELAADLGNLSERRSVAADTGFRAASEFMRPVSQETSGTWRCSVRARGRPTGSFRHCYVTSLARAPLDQPLQSARRGRCSSGCCRAVRRYGAELPRS